MLEMIQLRLYNECVEILGKLFKMKLIKKSDHKRIFSTLRWAEFGRSPHDRRDFIRACFFKLNKMSLIHIRSKENDFEISYSENSINLSGLKGQIALKTASLWYSWDNITEEYKNNEIIQVR
jgi:hypothetical protein